MKIIKKEDVRSHFNIAIVVSEFNRQVTEALYEGALARLKELNFTDEQITMVRVPGAVEIPITAQRLVRTDAYEAIVCLGSVIRGETSHYDYVCEQVSYGCQRVALENDIPVIFGVLTTENEEQALDRVGGRHGHKGREAIDAMMTMISVLRQIG